MRISDWSSDVCSSDLLPFHKISSRYFFETDMLFRLNTLRSVVIDIPMDAHYGDEVSNLKIKKIIGEFLIKHLRNTGKRIFYNYYLRDKIGRASCRARVCQYV